LKKGQIKLGFCGLLDQFNFYVGLADFKDDFGRFLTLADIWTLFLDTE